ncbi:MAG: ferredoxin reductase family protein, partial [Solirubrobacteraceae bacterium]
VTGMVAAYAMLVLVLLVARLPVIERVAGHDRLVAWHRRLGPWPLYLVTAHGTLITLGYAQQARTGALRELWALLSTYPGVLPGTAASALLVAAGVTSYRRARRRMAYETWWAVHLYTYLALFLAFSHQVATGAPFVGHPVARTLWTAMWIGGAALVVAYRVALPAWRTLRHRPRVVAVEHDAPGVVTLVVHGRALDRLSLAGGQFVQWRILRRGLWWQAHPYSISALPRPDGLRLTVKDLGDHSGALARIAPGTRLAIEGPYGAFTRHARRSDAVLLVGAGVGVAPIHALLEDLPAGVDVEVLVRASSERDLVLRDEIRHAAARRGARLHELVGSRRYVRLDREALLARVPDLVQRDVYLCGPDGLVAELAASATAAGVDPERIHSQAFAF